MAYADYAHCLLCDGKAVYDGDEQVRADDVVVMHKRCAVAVPAENLRRAIELDGRYDAESFDERRALQQAITDALGGDRD